MLYCCYHILRGKRMLKLIAFDLDGTLTQHKSPMCEANRNAMIALSKKYKLLMAGAGDCMRIFNQMEGFPIDVIGNYGMQWSVYNPATKTQDVIEKFTVPCDRASVESRITALRQKYGFTEYTGDNVQFHDSGVVTFPILGTKANLADKLAYDPDRKKRRAIYQDVCQTFAEFNVFVGGSSSFDMAPKPYDKNYALHEYCKRYGYDPSEVLFVGDDYGQGGNDESVYLSEIEFLKIDDYRTFAEKVQYLL